MITTEDKNKTLAPRLRAYQCEIAKQSRSITYQALGKELGLLPPNTIHQLTVALEYLIEEDAIATCPLIAALVVSKAPNGLPALGFFDCAQRVGRFDGDPAELEGSAFHKAEFSKVVEFWHP